MKSNNHFILKSCGKITGKGMTALTPQANKRLHKMTLQLAR